MSSNYARSLADFLFRKMEQHQTDPIITRNNARLSGSGFYFTDKDIEKWIEEHDGKSWQKKSN